MEACVNGMDSTFTSGLSKESFVRLVWVLTRQRPTVSLSSLRVEYYTQLNTKLRARHEALLNLPDSGMKDCVDTLLKQSELTDQIINGLCEELDFDEEWMTIKLGKAGKASGKAKAVEATRPLAPLLASTTATSPPPLASAKQPVPVPKGAVAAAPKPATVAAVPKPGTVAAVPKPAAMAAIPKPAVAAVPPTVPKIAVAKALMQSVPKMSLPMQSVPKMSVQAALPKQTVNPPLPKQTANPALPKQTLNPALPKQNMNPALPKQTVHPVLPKQSSEPQREEQQELASCY